MSVPPVVPQHKSSKTSRVSARRIAPEKTPSNHAEPAAQPGDSRLLDPDSRLFFPSTQIKDTSARFLLQEIARDLRPNAQIRKCLRRRIPGREIIEVWRKPEANRAYYQNLITCGKVWHCAVCAQRITETVRGELVELLGQGELYHFPEGQKKEFAFLDLGSDINRGGIPLMPVYIPVPVASVVVPLYHVAMGTFTIQHKIKEPAEMVIGRLLSAWAKMWGGRWAVGFWDHFRLMGLIRSIDYTYGDHGHHFHFHTLFVANSRIDDDKEIEMSYQLWTRWSESVEKIGGHTSRSAFDFQAGDASAAEYVAKLGVKPGEAGKSWGQIAELTRHPAKTGEGRTLWELLAMAGGGDKHAAAMWLEATDALKGKSWIRPSKGLLEKLGATLAVKSDEELSKEQIADLDLLFAGLPDDAFTVIKRLAKRGELLNQAGSGDVAAFRAWLGSLMVNRTTVNGTTFTQESETLSAGDLVPSWALEGLQGITERQGGNSDGITMEDLEI